MSGGNIITVGQESFELSDEQIKALEWDIYLLKDWIENAIKVKIAGICDKLIIANSNKNPAKMSYPAKITEVGSSGYDLTFEGYAIDITISSGNVFSLTIDETKILELTEVQLKDLVENILTKKASSCINEIVKRNTTDRLETLTDEQKNTIIANADIMSAYDRMNSSGMV
jgi:hypothetical protein